jgi:pimeloyl-ACP methyl ester carboxylesterase
LNHVGAIWITAVVTLVAVWVVSYIVERLRPVPTPPARLSWAPDVPVSYVATAAGRLRYVTTGQGPPLVLLHTLRTQLDMFQKVIPALAGRFRVYALDYLGHGYSDIPAAEYTPEFFVASVAGALEALRITNAVLVGESIGGSIALLLAARHHPAVGRIVAVNTYDYDRGRGLRRSSPVANVFFALADVPILGPTLGRLRQYSIMKPILYGGVYRQASMPAALAREMYVVGNRPGHYRAFMSLVRHWPEWEAARLAYASIDQPVLLVYGDHDWSRVAEREATRQGVPGAQMRIIREAGHFLALDTPEEWVRAVLDFAASR